MVMPPCSAPASTCLSSFPSSFFCDLGVRRCLCVLRGVPALASAIIIIGNGDDDDDDDDASDVGHVVARVPFMAVFAEVRDRQSVAVRHLIFPKRADYVHISGLSGMQEEGWTSAEGTEAGAKGAMANKEARQMASA